MAKHSLQAIVHKTVALRNNVVLLEACSVGKLNYIKTSIDAGADVHYTNENNETPFIKCCQLSPGEAEKCMKYLIKRGTDSNFQDKYGRTALSFVAEKGNSTMVDLLITKCDADPTIEDVKGNTALMYAICSGCTDIVAHLVGYFLVVNYPTDKRNFVGMTPLLLAAKMGRYECAKILVEVGSANIHLRDVDTFRSATDWIKVTCTTEELREFVDLDPIVMRKRGCARRRLCLDKNRYRVLSDFFTEGKMPSCWRNSAPKGTQDPRNNPGGRTICIVSHLDNKDTSPKLSESEMDDAIDNILINMSEPSPINSCYASENAARRSMFDIPNLMEIRQTIQDNTGGRFIERPDSCMSVVSAPSPTFSRFDDTLAPEDVSPTATSPTSPTLPKIKKMERRRSIDNSSLLARPNVNSPIVNSPSGRRVSRSNTLPKSTTEPRVATRKTPDPLKNARPPPEASLTKTTSNQTQKSKTSRIDKHCKERKTSLPNISKNSHIVRDYPTVHT